MAEIRTALAEAASTVEAVNCSPHFRASMKAGDGAIRWDRKTPDGSGFGWLHTWQVVVFLPQDLGSAEKWMDANTDALADAVNTVPNFALTDVTREQLTLDTGTVPVLFVTGNHWAE